MIIPYEQLSPSTLSGLIESFVLREGTDYGDVEVSLSDKVHQVEMQLRRKEVVILFDENTQSVNLLSSKEAKEIGWD